MFGNFFIFKRKKSAGYDFDPGYFLSENKLIDDESFIENKKEFIGKYLTDKKIIIFFGILLVGLILLLSKAVYLQVIKANYYHGLAEGNRVREIIIKTPRGMIYDRNQVPLVKNYPIFDVAITPIDLPTKKESRDVEIKNIASIINITPEAIEQIIGSYPKYTTVPIAIRENILYEEALLIKIKGAEMAALSVETRNNREYINNSSLGHILGYIGKINEKEYEENKNNGYLLNDYIGKNGLELFYEDILRGKYGNKKIEVDAKGNEKKVLAITDAQKSKNLILSIDYKLQDKVKSILAKALTRLNKTTGVVVLEDPRNGEILAMVSLPDFDNNLFASGISTEKYNQLANDENKPLFDRSIKGTYPPGSTIKPVIGAAALQEKVVTDKTSFLSTGGITVFERYFFPDWNLSGHGLTNIYRAIAWSVNTYFYIVGGGYEDFKGLGLDNLLKYFEFAGLGQKTGIDIYGESAGFLPTPEWKKQAKNEDWYIGDTYHISIGQGDLLVTPLQIANYTSMIANGGTLFIPHLVKNIINVETGNNESQDNKIINNNKFAEENLKIIRRAMRETVISGSAQSLQNVGVSVAGKTGTAQWHPDKENHAWFTGFAPYENPEVAITVLVEEGKEGSTVAVPIAREILDYYFGAYKTN